MTKSKSGIVPDELAMNKIYYIRNQKVMLDSDLAELYGVSTGNLNKTVKRNIKRFPDDFVFQLNKEEFNLMFQIGISNWRGKKASFCFHKVRRCNVSIFG